MGYIATSVRQDGEESVTKNLHGCDSQIFLVVSETYIFSPCNLSAISNDII
jgi:hypothetical protein